MCTMTGPVSACCAWVQHPWVATSHHLRWCCSGAECGASGLHPPSSAPPRAPSLGPRPTWMGALTTLQMSHHVVTVGQCHDHSPWLKCPSCDGRAKVGRAPAGDGAAVESWDGQAPGGRPHTCLLKQQPARAAQLQSCGRSVGYNITSPNVVSRCRMWAQLGAPTFAPPATHPPAAASPSLGSRPTWTGALITLRTQMLLDNITITCPS